MDQWLPLTDYATKYKVSVSTLRRRIKAEDIKFLFQEGKYFISDKPISLVSKVSPSLGYSSVGNNEMEQAVDILEEPKEPQAEIADADFLENLRKTASTKLPQVKNEMGMLNKSKNITAEFELVKENSGIKEFSEKIAKIGNNEPILTAANKLLAELKKAYTQILQEKEEQIMTLKEEVSDLRTLVKVLESENNRIKNSWSSNC